MNSIGKHSSTPPDNPGRQLKNRQHKVDQKTHPGNPVCLSGPYFLTVTISFHLSQMMIQTTKVGFFAFFQGKYLSNVILNPISREDPAPNWPC
jgi:hypothetical protein